MKSIFSLLILSVSLCLASCEKDFVYDEDCLINNGSGNIGGWENPKDTTVVSKDSVSNEFIVEVNEWGDTIYKGVIISK